MLASWLPDNTETFIVVNTRHTIQKPYAFGETKNLSESMKLIVLAAYPDELTEALQGTNFKLAVAGRRNFQAPSDLGLGQHDGCEIFKIDPSKAENLLAKLGPLKPATEVIAGLNTSVVKIEDWTWFIALDNDLLFIATDRDYLAEVLERRESPAVRLDISGELWGHIDTAAPLFAVRTYTDALRESEATNMNDEDIIGFAMTLDESKDELRIVSVSVSPEGFERAQVWGEFLSQEGWSGRHNISRVDDLATLISLQASADGMPSLLIASALGHVVFI